MYRPILVAAALIRLLLLIVVPFGGTISHGLQGLNDEQAHFHYVAYIAENRAFPVQVHSSRTPGAIERADFEYYQPPLYYLLCAPIYAFLHTSPALYACRLISFVCGLLSLFVLSRILQNMGLSRSRRRQAVLFLALLPSHAYFSSVVSNDSLAWLIGFLLTERLFALYERTRAAPDTIGRLGSPCVVGLLLGLGMLTKSSLAVFYPVAAFAYGYVFQRTRRPRVIWCGFLALATSLIVAGAWYLRNVALYGSLMALHVGFGPPSAGRFDSLIHIVRSTARTFWFPMQHEHVRPLGVVRLLRALGGLILAAHAVAALRYMGRETALTVKAVTLGLLMSLALVAQLYVGVGWMTTEARFMFPALAAIVFFLVVPAADLLRRWGWTERFITAYFCLLALHPYLFLLFVRDS